jgi:hypothetical protein
MSDERNLYDAIEACRPGSRDHVAPELDWLARELERNPAAREYYERVQRADAAIVAAIADVPVPTGLAERLLAGLAAGRQDENAASDPAAPMPASLQRSVAIAGTTHRTRRWLVLTAAACVVALVAGGVPLALLLWGPQPPTVAQLIDEVTRADGWIDQAIAGQSWEGNLSLAPTERAADDENLRYDPFAFQVLPNRFDDEAVVYQIPAPANARALLFVTQCRSDDEMLGTAPPVVPQNDTGGWSIGVWQRDGLVYVLAVEGDPQLYRGLIRYQEFG